MKKQLFFEKLDAYVDLLLDQVLLECGYDTFGEDEISNRVSLAKTAADTVSSLIQPNDANDFFDTTYEMPTRRTGNLRAPVAAEI